jgi:PAS domain S-box-containing protein
MGPESGCLLRTRQAVSRATLAGSRQIRRAAGPGSRPRGNRMPPGTTATLSSIQDATAVGSFWRLPNRAGTSQRCPGPSPTRGRVKRGPRLPAFQGTSEAHAGTAEGRSADELHLHDLIERAYVRARENHFDAVVVTDSDGRIVDWNTGSERLYGYGREEVIGRPVSLLHAPEDREHVLGAVISAIERTGRWEGEIRLLRKDGSRGWIESAVVPVKDATGVCQSQAGRDPGIPVCRAVDRRLFSRLHRRTGSGQGVGQPAAPVRGRAAGPTLLLPGFPQGPLHHRTRDSRQPHPARWGLRGSGHGPGRHPPAGGGARAP